MCFFPHTNQNNHKNAQAQGEVLGAKRFAPRALQSSGRLDRQLGEGEAWKWERMDKIQALGGYVYNIYIYIIYVYIYMYICVHIYIYIYVWPYILYMYLYITEL